MEECQGKEVMGELRFMVQTTHGEQLQFPMLLVMGRAVELAVVVWRASVD